MKNTTKYSKFTDLIGSSSYISALSGAGVSTLSGISDFRSEKGLYKKYDPYELFGLENFLKNPETYYEFAAADGKSLIYAEPNLTHHFLYKLERSGKLNAVITQNIDGLHRKAGNSKVYELHGTYTRSYCYNCRKEFDSFEIMNNYNNTGEVPYCDCGGIIKPDVVFFGESLPHDQLSLSILEAARSDLMIIIGTSLTVSPANVIPLETLKNGGKIVIMNMMETHLDPHAELTFHEDFRRLIPELESFLQKSRII